MLLMCKLPIYSSNISIIYKDVIINNNNNNNNNNNKLYLSVQINIMFM